MESLTPAKIPLHDSEAPVIYFIQDSLTFRIKIGFAGKDDPLARLTELQTGNSSLLYLLASRPGDKQVEADLHEQFNHYHTQGEWFNPGPELLQYVIGCSAVDMARHAVGVAAMKLVEQSFPETKAEAERRELAQRMDEAASFLRRLRQEGKKVWADGNNVMVYPCHNLHQYQHDAIKNRSPWLLIILRQEKADGLSEEPPPPRPPEEGGLKKLWAALMQSLPPLMVSQMEKAGTPTLSGPAELTLTFSSRHSGERDYCSEPTRLARIEACLLKLSGKPWTVSVVGDDRGLSYPLSLPILAERVSGCTRCAELASTRTRTVFGYGNSDRPALCLIGEAPAQTEDETGMPFTGQTSELINWMISACNLKRDDVYLCNLLKCRPPKNRTPSAEEAANCLDYLNSQLALIGPRFLCLLGSTPARYLLNNIRSLSSMRQQVHRYEGIPTVCTYHPAYLLPHRSDDPNVIAERKRLVWEDMAFLARQMGIGT